jgi:competence ComEA-like helix-hairpin-helix protein
VVYRRRELWLLLFLAATLGVGLAVREFRAGFPELAERLEGLDAEAEPATPPERRWPHPLPPAPPKISEDEARANGQLDLNTATRAELQRLPGIGPALAQRIVEVRERHGRFADPGDLRRVPGIGARKLEAIQGLVTVTR